MYSIRSNPDYESASSGEAIFRLEGEIRTSTAKMAKDVATIEGRSVTNTLRKVLWVYHELDLHTRKFGTTLLGTTDGRIDNSKRVLTPKEFLRQSRLPDDGRRSSLLLNIREDTKNIIEHHIERDAGDFDSLMTGAFAYYGLLATHLYGGESIYLETLLPRKLERFVVVE